MRRVLGHLTPPTPTRRRERWTAHGPVIADERGTRPARRHARPWAGASRGAAPRGSRAATSAAGDAHADRGVDRVRDAGERRHDRHLADAAHAVRVTRVRHLDEHGVDHRQVVARRACGSRGSSRSSSCRPRRRGTPRSAPCRCPARRRPGSGPRRTRGGSPCRRPARPCSAALDLAGVGVDLDVDDVAGERRARRVRRCTSARPWIMPPVRGSCAGELAERNCLPSGGRARRRRRRRRPRRRRPPRCWAARSSSCGGCPSPPRRAAQPVANVVRLPPVMPVKPTESVSTTCGLHVVVRRCPASPRTASPATRAARRCRRSRPRG